MAIMTPQHSGKVKWFNAQKGFGFIVPDLGGGDIFLHQSALDASGIKGLKEGQEIEYDVIAPRRTVDKPKACNLRLI